MKRFFIFCFLLILTCGQFVSCDPSEEFTGSSTITVAIVNETDKTLWLECNWKADSEGNLSVTEGVLEPQKGYMLWRDVVFPFCFPSVYEFILSYLEKNCEDSRISIYSYDSTNNSKGELIKTWKLDEAGKESFFSENNTHVSTDYYPRPGSHKRETLIFFITDEIIKN